MYLPLVLFLLAAVSTGCSAQDYGAPVVETKTMKVEPTSDLVASCLATIKFIVALPKMTTTVQAANLSGSCKASLGVRYNNFCSAIDHIVHTSNGVLNEVSSVFMSIQKGLRQKRALIPWLGDNRRWIEGTATEKQLHKVIKSVNNLGHTVQSLSHSNQESIT